MDDDLIEEAVRDNRILLTRDEVLVKRARRQGVKAIYIVHGGDEEALNQLVHELFLIFDPTHARCPKCNHTVEIILKQDVAGKVPDGTFGAVDDYWVCPICRSIYWRGSHWQRIVDTLRGAGRSAS